MNYQRIRNLLFDKISYDDLEEALKEVNDIKCTASFSSLDFERACGFKVGGIFMRPPFRADLHRVDIAWAIVGDIGCSIYYQYKQLTKMMQLDTPYLLGCGGGFQSNMLCQHIADLTGKPLRLPYGYEQASILGCGKLCNAYFHMEERANEQEYIIYSPKCKQLIHMYYDSWQTNRNKINNV